MSNMVAELYLSITELISRMQSRDYEESATYQGGAISLNFAVALRKEGWRGLSISHALVLVPLSQSSATDARVDLVIRNTFISSHGCRVFVLGSIVAIIAIEPGILANLNFAICNHVHCSYLDRASRLCFGSNQQSRRERLSADIRLGAEMA